MRWTTLALVIALAFVCPGAYGQITLSQKNAPLEKVLSAIEKQTRFVFLYDPDDLRIGPITIDVKNASLQETLEKCFKGKPIEWTVMGNNVLLKKKTFKFYDYAISGRRNDRPKFGAQGNAAAYFHRGAQ
jgi:hypothetical protein